MDDKKIEKDDIIYGVMIMLCRRTKDAEKAKKLWDIMLDLPDIRLNCLHYTSLIKVLATRKDYCEEAI